MIRKVAVAKVLAADLSLRASADRFFDFLEKLKTDSIEIDFAEVKSISRSFAQQYLARKSESQKAISELNVPQNVERMFQVIRTPTHKSELVAIGSLEVKTL